MIFTPRTEPALADYVLSPSRVIALRFPPPRLRSAINTPLSSVRRLYGPEHPDSGFESPSVQHNRRPCNRSTSLRNTPCHGFHDSSRYTIRPAVLTTWHGTWIIATQN